ncbi:MAG: antitoxin [Caulobacteraceae bacterium]
MPTVKSRTFRSGNSQAIRLPKDVAYPDGTELTIVRSGEVMTIYPAKRPIKEMIETLLAMSGPRSIEERDSDIFPERPSL